MKSQQVINVPVAQIIPWPNQPRKNFDPAKIQSLANSIARIGQLEPLKLKRVTPANSKFVLIDGERRLRALQHLKAPTRSISSGCTRCGMGRIQNGSRRKNKEMVQNVCEYQRLNLMALTHSDRMWFGSHKGMRLQDVPGRYFLWLRGQWAEKPPELPAHIELRAYVEKHIDAIRRQAAREK